MDVTASKLDPVPFRYMPHFIKLKRSAKSSDFTKILALKINFAMIFDKKRSIIMDVRASK